MKMTTCNFRSFPHPRRHSLPSVHPKLKFVSIGTSTCLLFVGLFTFSGCRYADTGMSLPESDTAYLQIDRRPIPCPDNFGVLRLDDKTEADGKNLTQFDRFRISKGVHLLAFGIPHHSKGQDYSNHIFMMEAEAGHSYTLYWRGFPDIGIEEEVKIVVMDNATNEPVVRYVSMDR